jgi:hypothetical protein
MIWVHGARRRHQRARMFWAVAAVVLGAGWWASRASADILQAVACPSAGQCTAVDDSGHQVTFSLVSPALSTPRTIDAHGGLDDVACPALRQCTAVSATGTQVTFNPASAHTRQPVTIDLNSSPDAIACPMPTQCTEVDNDGAEVTFNPASPGHHRRITLDVTDDNYPSPIGLDDVACPSIDTCVAVDEDGGELTFDPRHPPSSYSFASDSGGGNPSYVDTADQSLLAVACPAANQCSAVDQSGNAVTFDPRHPGAARTTQVDPAGKSLNGVACPTTGQCTAVDAAGDSVTFDPLTPAATPLVEPTDPGTSLSGIACTSAGLCTAVGGAVEITFDPTESGSPGPAVTDPGPAVTGSDARATGFGRGHAELAFTLTASADAAAISWIEVPTPKGVTFSDSPERLARGILVTTGGSKVSSTAGLNHGRLMITFSAPARSLHVTIARPALTPAKTLADEVRTGDLTAIAVTVLVTNVELRTTRLLLRARAA